MPINGLAKKFLKTYKFCKNDINRFLLLLRKGVYPYEYPCIHSWERFNENTLLNKKAFYSKLYREDITDEDYIDAPKVFQNLNEEIQANIMIYMFKMIHFCLQMYLKILEVIGLKYKNLILLIFFFCVCISMENFLKKRQE